MTIGPKTIREIGSMTEKLVKDYQKEIEAAYLRADGGLTIGFQLKIDPAKYGSGIDLEMAINFVAERIKDKTTSSINEKQMELKLAPPKPAFDRAILFRKYDTGWPTPEILKANTPKKESVKYPKAPPFFKRETKRLRALLFKNFDTAPIKKAA